MPEWYFGLWIGLAIVSWVVGFFIMGMAADEWEEWDGRVGRNVLPQKWWRLLLVFLLAPLWLAAWPVIVPLAALYGLYLVYKKAFL